VWLALLQFVDDAALLATSPQELQHMITVIARYCAKNLLLLNAKPGKTEVVEFMCPPTGYTYEVPSPTADSPGATTALSVSLTYPYLGWCMDVCLTMDAHTTKVANAVVAATEKVVNMGGFTVGLPVLSTLHLWTSLVLSYVYAAVVLLTPSK
jgi:hypothetical protein